MLLSSSCHLVFGVLLLLAPTVKSSVGDRSDMYRQCVSSCRDLLCHAEGSSGKERAPSIASQLFYWDCYADCGYSCTWKTVEGFQRNGWPVPQFHGKWPFIRFMGLQEPASVLFSLLNAAAHLFGIREFRKRVSSAAPCFLVWNGYCLVALNAWFWSAVFHTRDLDFTEKMDYFCATSLVMYQLFGLFARILVFKPRIFLWLVSALISTLCLFHVYRMGFVHFDYGYHVKVNLAIGIVNAVGWLGWSLLVRRRQPYVWMCCCCIILCGLLLSLELLDFSPFLWTFDAHSLWHAGTVPLTVLWYRFAVADCQHMLRYGAIDKQSLPSLID